MTRGVDCGAHGIGCDVPQLGFAEAETLAGDAERLDAEVRSFLSEVRAA